MYIVADAEWNGDKADKIHVVSLATYPKGDVKSFTNMKEFEDWVLENKPDKWFFHAGLTADIPVINNYFGYELVAPDKVVDTFVVSRLVNYKKFNTHSLKELGQFLGVHKGDYDGGWEYCSEEMIEYCEGDVEVLRAIVDHYWKYIKDPKWSKSMRLEHDIATICYDIQDNGFLFDKEKAQSLLEDVEEEMEKLEENFKSTFEPKLVEEKRLKLKYTADGRLYRYILNAMDEYPKVEFDEEAGEVIVYTYKEFNPASPKERIDVLWEAGWEPFEKTKGHIQKLRETYKK